VYGYYFIVVLSDQKVEKCNKKQYLWELFLYTFFKQCSYFIIFHLRILNLKVILYEITLKSRKPPQKIILSILK